jgi:hypothetical protein
MRACSFLLFTLFALYLNAQPSPSSRHGISLVMMAGRAAPPQVSADYIPAVDANVRFRPQLAFSGELRYRISLNEHWDLLGGLGFGGNSFRYDLFATPSFTGFDWAFDSYAWEAPVFQLFSSLGAGYYRPLSPSIEWGADLQWQGGVFFTGTNSISHSMTDETGRFLTVYRLNYQSTEDFFQALVISPGLRWAATPWLRIHAKLAALVSGANILDDSHFNLTGEAKAYTGTIDLPYRWLGLQVEVAYQW